MISTDRAEYGGAEKWGWGETGFTVDSRFICFPEGVSRVPLCEMLGERSSHKIMSRSRASDVGAIRATCGYSSRRTARGSTRVARNAGTRLAANDTRISNIVTARKVTRSRELTP